MRRQPYDYSGFSLRKLNEPRFAHVKSLGGWLVYFAHLAFTGLFAVTICYIKPIVKALKKCGKKAPAAEALPDNPADETNDFAENKANN